MSDLTVRTVDGQAEVLGVAGDATVAAPLGQRYFTVGAHLVGFDQSFREPIVMRAYYNPTADPRLAQESRAGRALDHIGYFQAVQLTYAGTAIPPDVFGGRIADRWPYVDNDYRFLDFMGPSDVLLRGLENFPPFYAYNAVLLDGSLTSTDDFFRHPRPNGSLYRPPTRPVARLDDAHRSQVASIVTEVATGLITPADVARVLADLDPLLILAPDPADLARTEGYRLALAALRTDPLPTDPPGSPAPLADVDDDEIVAQLVGPYVLLTLPADDGMPETLCVWLTATTPQRVVVHLLSVYDVAEITSRSGSAVLTDIGSYLAGKGALGNIEPPPAAPLRGRQPPGGEPMLVTDATRLRCELRYWTFAVGTRDRKRKRTRGAEVGALGDRLALLSGFTWAALYRFDPDSDELELAALREPEPSGAVPLKILYTAFVDGLAPRFANEAIDTTNFTGAALRRDRFGTQAGEPVPFVDARHVDTVTDMDLDTDPDQG